MNLEYPNLESVSEEAKKLNYVYENYIQNLSDEESEEFSQPFYEFMEKVGEIADQNEISSDAFISHYKAIMFLKMYDKLVN